MVDLVTETLGNLRRNYLKDLVHVRKYFLEELFLVGIVLLHLNLHFEHFSTTLLVVLYDLHDRLREVRHGNIDSLAHLGGFVLEEQLSELVPLVTLELQDELYPDFLVCSLVVLPPFRK